MHCLVAEFAGPRLQPLRFRGSRRPPYRLLAAERRGRHVLEFKPRYWNSNLGIWVLGPMDETKYQWSEKALIVGEGTRSGATP